MSNGRKYIIIQVVLFSIALGWYIVSPEGIDLHYIRFSLILTSLICIAHLIWRRGNLLRRSWLSLDTAFIPGFIIVNCAIPLYLSAGWIKALEVNFKAGSHNYVNHGAALVASALAAFSIGFIYSSRRRAESRRKILSDSNKRRNKNTLNLVALFSGGFSWLLTIYFLIRYGAQYLGGSYSGIGELGSFVAVYIQFAITFTSIGGVCAILQIISRRGVPSASALLVLTPTALWAGMLMIHGDRSGMVQLCLPVLGATLLNFRVKLSLILGAVFIALPAFAIVGNARNAEERGKEALLEGFSQSNLSEASKDAALTLGGSGILLNVSMAHAKESGIYFGRLQAMGLLGLIPFSRTYFGFDFFGLKEYEGSSSSILTRILNGPNARWGVGTSPMAELFMDLGSMGVIVGHLILGCIGGVIERRYRFTRSYPSIVYYLITLGAFAIISRYMFSGFLMRQIIYPIVIFWALWKTCELYINNFGESRNKPIRYLHSPSRKISAKRH